MSFQYINNPYVSNTERQSDLIDQYNAYVKMHNSILQGRAKAERVGMWYAPTKNQSNLEQKIKKLKKKIGSFDDDSDYY